MKKIFFKYLIGAAIVVSAICSCSKKLGDVNYSTNNPAQPQTALLISNAQRQIAGIISSVTPRYYVQHISDVFYTNGSRYFDKVFDYSAIYNNPLQDLNLVIQLNTDAETKAAPNVIIAGSNANQIASSRILKAFLFLNMTDRWGDIPYTEALQGLAKITPKFDAQQAIYTDIFKELTEAVAQFDAGALKGDILFAGSISKWKKFANTIKLVAALHLSKKDPATGKAKFNEALAAGVLTSNADNIYYNYLAESANENPFYNNYEVAKRYDFAISKTMVDALKATNDPRLPVYASPTNPTAVGAPYVGMPYGLLQGAAGYSAGTVSNPGNISLIGAKFRQQNSPVAIYTYAMVLFSIAEAHKLGWITGAPNDAEAAIAYNAGITASMKEQGIGDAAIATYLAQPSVVYDPANAIKQIITEKWVATFMGYGYETWADWRRTGFPVLTPTPNAYYGLTQIPRRQNYTTQEKDLNGTNYSAVIASQGPDEVTTKVWWDKP